MEPEQAEKQSHLFTWPPHPRFPSPSSVLICWLCCERPYLEGVVCGEGEGEAAGEEDGEGVLVVVQEQGVVAEGAHAQPDLAQVVQVLQRQRLAQIDAVRNVLAQQQAAHQVIHIPSLTCTNCQLTRKHAVVVHAKQRVALV